MAETMTHCETPACPGVSVSLTPGYVQTKEAEMLLLSLLPI